MIDQDPMPQAATRDPTSGHDRVTAAEQELGAFLIAVKQKFGAETVHRAGEYWLEALNRHPYLDWRRITIAAASRVARDSMR